jgi:uncharacterized membrane protein YfcA
MSRLIPSLLLSFALTACSRLGYSQTPLRAERSQVRPEWALRVEQLTTPTPRGSDSAVSHRRATVIGATTGAVVGGLGTAALILNALAPDCITAVAATSSGSTVHSSHCTHRSRIVVLQTVTIAAGATVGGFAGVWVARRIARWRDHRHLDPQPNGR